MNKRLARWLPTRESLHNNRWLRWLGPALHHPRLWHMSRKGLALGMAHGIFFGLLIPVAQIPFSAALAVALRATPLHLRYNSGRHIAAHGPGLLAGIACVSECARVVQLQAPWRCPLSGQS